METGTRQSGGHQARADRLTLLPHELAFLLGVPRSQIARLIRSGVLRNASRDARKRVAFEDALELIQKRTAADDCSPLAELLLEELRRHRLTVSREEAEWLTVEAALGRCLARRSDPDVSHVAS